ncbi:MAG: sensor histidine kinase N-terminal domain-containing protein [Sulfuricaulis sp.]
MPLGVLCIFNAGTTFYLAKSFSNRAYDQALFDTTRTLADQVQTIGRRTKADAPPVAWNSLHYYRYDQIFSDVRWVDGGRIAGNSYLEPPVAALHVVGKPIFHNSVYQGVPIRVAALYITVNDHGKPRQLLVQTAETLNKRNFLEKEIISGVMLPQLVLIMLAAMSVWKGVRRGLMPLQKARDAIGNRSERDLSPVAEHNAPHEIRPLLHAINVLMERLSQALEAQQRFVADAAHQLRTPLAGLITQSEFALRQTDPESLQHSLSQIKTGAERANRLIHQLLTLARSQNSPVSPSVFVLLDLNDLLQQVTSEWVPAAMSKEIDLGYEGQNRAVTIKGNVILLREMLANLLDNAIRYSPKGGSITVRLSNLARPLIAVEDDGPGIPIKEREHVFERFHRLPGTEGDGSGLGLAIVREIAKVHGAHAWFVDRPGVMGAQICVQFERSV